MSTAEKAGAKAVVLFLSEEDTPPIKRLLQGKSVQILNGSDCVTPSTVIVSNSRIQDLFKCTNKVMYAIVVIKKTKEEDALTIATNAQKEIDRLNINFIGALTLPTGPVNTLGVLLRV